MTVEPLVVSAVEAARLIKVDMSKMSALLANGDIPAYKDGWNWKIPKTLLQAYIENKAIEEAKTRRRAHEESKKQKE